MKILSNKKLEQIKQELTNYEMDKQDWHNTESTYLEQVKALINDIKEINKNNNKDMETKDNEITELKLKIKNMKSLCTKNGIDYSKIFNKKESK